MVVAISSYAMSCFLIPNKIYNSINSSQRKFWWESSENKKKINWVAWQCLKSTKKVGGLGFRNLHDFNEALLTKQVWRILNNPGVLWVRLLKSLYFPKFDFLSSKIRNNYSWAWRSIHSRKETHSKGLRWHVGLGKDLTFGRILGSPCPITLKSIFPKSHPPLKKLLSLSTLSLGNGTSLPSKALFLETP